jgi:hypothetical protein
MKTGSDKPDVNAVCLQEAVLCADCEVISDSPNDSCLVCGSHSLFSLSRVLGGSLPAQRTRLVQVEAREPNSATSPSPLTYRIPRKRVRHRMSSRELYSPRSYPLR